MLIGFFLIPLFRFRSPVSKGGQLIPLLSEEDLPLITFTFGTKWTVFSKNSVSGNEGHPARVSECLYLPTRKEQGPCALELILSLLSPPLSLTLPPHDKVYRMMKTNSMRKIPPLLSLNWMDLVCPSPLL